MRIYHCHISRTLLPSLWLGLLLACTALTALAQDGRPANPAARKGPAVKDSTTLMRDSIPLGKKGDIETTVVYSAEDSIVFDVVKRELHLYGASKITYGKIKLEAGLVDIDLGKNELRAYPMKDSTGRALGKPHFEDDAESFDADTIIYNFKTQKGIVKGAVTEQEGGFVHSELSKKMPDGILYNSRAIYTTCNLDDDPHFAIRAHKLKLAPKKYVVSGPFNLEVNNIPTPLALPFGFFPIPEKRTSGIIVPKYGEATDRGYYLRDGGFYWAINDYMDLQLLGQIYSRGGWGASANYNYNKRYAFSGALNFSYNRIIRENTDFTNSISNDFWISWSHSPVSKGTGRFSASVNAGSSSFNRNNSFNTQNYLSPSFNSNISYSKTFAGTPFSASINLRHNQNVQTGEVKVFPEANFSMNRVFPFKTLIKNQKSPLAQLNLAYTFNSKLSVSNTNLGQRFSFRNIQENNIDPDSTYQFSFDNASFLLGQADYGARHSIPISTSINLLKYIQLSPDFQFDELWYPKRFNYAWDEEAKAVRVTEEQGFFRATTFSMNAGMNTVFYAFYYFKSDRIKAIRQLIRPSVSGGIRPDFTSDKYGYFQNVQVGADGRMQRLSRFEGGIFGSPSGNASKDLSVSLENLFELKVRSPKDTVNGEKKIQLLRMNASYNVLADSFNLSNITMVTSTQLFNNLISITLNAGFDPYAYRNDYNEEGELRISTKTPVYAWNQGQGIGRIANASLALSSSLTPSGFRKTGDAVAQSEVAGQDARTALLADIQANPGNYVDFNIPWSLNLSYNLSYNRTGFNDPNVTQSFTFSGDLSLSEKWKINVSSGYDFQEKAFSFTNIGIMRDLHCWTMNVSWIPFGARQSYTIDIAVKSSLLQDLKISKRNVWFDR